MSRSVHATLRHPRDTGDLERKRRIKNLVQAERKRSPPATLGVERAHVPIVLRDRGPFVQYPAGERDLRGVLARLPDDATAGLASIELLLDESRGDEGDLDPFVGRLTREVAPGVFGGRLLGRYYGEEPKIQLFAYVYDRTTPNLEIVETYLRLRMLSTFVHELAHHRQALSRGSRGRWRVFESHEEDEIYAEAIEHAWTHEYVIPFLEEAYPRELSQLRSWVEKHGGLALDLDLLAGDPRTTRGEDGARLFFRVDMAFEGLLAAVANGDTAPQPQIEFARDLHYGEHYDEALTILARVLEAHSSHGQAMTLMADIFAHQKRFDEAEQLARRVLIASHEETFDAEEVLATVAQARGDWRGVLEVTSRAVRAPNQKRPWAVWSLVELKARAEIELGDCAAAYDSIESLPSAGSRTRTIRRLRALLLLRQDKLEEALEAAEAGLAETHRSADLLAIRFEAARRLGRDGVSALDEDVLTFLEGWGYATWVRALRALGD